MVAGDLSASDAPVRLPEEQLRMIELQRKVDELLEEKMLTSRRATNNPNPNSDRAVEHMKALGFTNESIESAEKKARLYLRGPNLQDEFFSWMGSSIESGTWPTSTGKGYPSPELSIVERVGPEVIANEFEIGSVWNLLNVPLDKEGIQNVWGDYFYVAVKRLPSSFQSILMHKYGDGREL
jgi:hypothetical protein